MIRGVSPELNEEALRVINSMPVCRRENSGAKRLMSNIRYR